MKKRLPTVMLLLGGLLTLYLIHNAWSADEMPSTSGDSGSVGANLTFAYLYGADLTGADLTGANLTGAKSDGRNSGRSPLERHHESRRHEQRQQQRHVLLNLRSGAF